MKTTAANELTTYFICLRTDLSMVVPFSWAGDPGRMHGGPANVLVRSQANKGQGSPLPRYRSRRDNSKNARMARMASSALPGPAVYTGKTCCCTSSLIAAQFGAGGRGLA